MDLASQQCLFAVQQEKGDFIFNILYYLNLPYLISTDLSYLILTNAKLNSQISSLQKGSYSNSLHLKYTINTLEITVFKYYCIQKHLNVIPLS